MPRAGLTRPDVISAGAQLADDLGYPNLAMAPLAERLGVKTPSLYKHVNGLPDLQREIATLALTELSEAVRDALQGRTGLDALSAFAKAFCTYIADHPGRYAATIGLEPTTPDDPMAQASARLLESISTVLRGYAVPDTDLIHALRMLRSIFHGFATLRASDGFQWEGPPDESLDWIINFIDQGLHFYATD